MKDSMLNQLVTVTVDRPLGSHHPKHHDILYPVNYGYIANVMGGDQEEQDAYILGVDYPISTFTGRVIAIVHRLNDVEDKWIVVPEGVFLSQDEILQQIHFQEKYFEIELYPAPEASSIPFSNQ